MTEGKVQETQVTVSVPQASQSLAQAISKAVVDSVKAKKSGDTGAKFVMDEIQIAINDLAGAVVSAPQVGGDAQGDVLGMAEAFAIQGFETAKAIKAL